MNPQSLEERVDASEKRLKELFKEKKAQDDQEVVRIRRKLCDDICDLIQLKRDNDDARAERLWRVCFHKRIDDYRKRLASLPAGHAQRKVLGEFRQFLGEATKFFSNFAESLDQNHVLARIFTCLGDIARYRELVADSEEKRYTEAIEWYRKAVDQWPESGAAHNQLAVIATYQKRALIAVYRYQRALACARPFEAARNNLKQSLAQSCQANSADVNAPPQEEFLARCLRLEAFILFPEDPITLEAANKDLRDIQAKLPILLKSRTLRTESTMSLLLSSMFTVTHGNVFERSSHDNRKSDLAKAVFRVLAVAFLDHACQEAETVGDNESKDKLKKREHSAAFAKTMLPISVMSDFLQLRMDLMDAEVKSRYEMLDYSLARAPIEKNGVKNAMMNLALDEDEAEYAGYTPLGPRYSAAIVELKLSPDLSKRTTRIRAFVRDFVEADLKIFSADGNILSNHPAFPISLGEYDDEEEEEILFRPSFSGAMPAAGAVANTPLPPSGFVSNTTLAAPVATLAPIPPQLYSFSANVLGGSAWGAPAQSNGGVPYMWSTDAWGGPMMGGTGIQPAYSAAGAAGGDVRGDRSARQGLSPPPGFQQQQQQI